MGEIPGYSIQVLRNGSDISNHVVSGSSTLEKGKFTRSWELEFAEPMDLDPSDTWTIHRSIAGYRSTWCENVTASGFSGSDGVDSGETNAVRLVCSRRVNGDALTDEAADLLNYCVPKTLVFVNEDWLLNLYPTSQVVDGILVYGGSSPFGLPSNRIYDPRLPGVEFEADSFQCIVGVQTHHDIAKYLARCVGFELMVNTPNVPIIDTMTITSGTTWIAAIEGIFRNLWFPTIEIWDGTIYVSDILVDNLTVPAIQKITLQNKAIQTASVNKTITDKQNPVDHVIITGRKTQDTTILQPEAPDYTVVDIPEIALAATLDVEVGRTFSDKLKFKQMDTYAGTFGIPGEEVQPKGIKSTTHTMHFYVDEQYGRRKYVTVGETINSYDYSDIEVARKVTEYKYGKGYVPVRTIEKEYAYFNMPGTETKDLHLVNCKTTFQRHCKKALNLTLTEEIFEGLVLYENVTIDGTEYKTDPMILGDVLRSDPTRSMVETDEDTKQATLEMTLSEKQTAIFRTHDDILIKHEQTHDELTNYTRHNSQILENPQRDRNKVKADHIFRKEYFDGPGKLIGGYGPCYHPVKTINHEDICTEAIADQVAARAFARKNVDSNDEWSVTLPFPVPIESIATVVALPDFVAQVKGTAVTVSGGDFVLTKVMERFNYSGDGNAVQLRPETVLTVRKRY